MNAALSGFNGTLMAYGQTGSGVASAVLFFLALNQVWGDCGYQRSYAEVTSSFVIICCDITYHFLGKTHTLMAPDGITAGVIERCFKRITQDDLHDYKVTL